MTWTNPYIIATCGAASLITLAAAVPPTTSNTAEQYFRCEQGYAFETSSKAARCIRPGGQMTTAVVCPAGSTPTVDLVNNDMDMCVPPQPQLPGKYSCPPNYAAAVKPGPDSCTRQLPPKIVPPSVPIIL